MNGDTKNISIRRAANMLRIAEGVLIICHARPDGDTLGSAIALETLLRRLSVPAYAVCDDIIPESNEFILGFRDPLPEGTEPLSSMRPENLPKDFAPDVIVTVDVASLHLAGEFGESLRGRIDLKIDHHAMGESFAKHELVYPGCSSCAEVVYDLALELGTLNRQSARAIYTGMVTDSGSFKFSSVTAETHEKAAALLRMGINHDEISDLLYNSKTSAELAAMALALSNIRFAADGAVAYITLSRAELDARGITRGDTDGVNAVPLEVKGVKIGFVIKEDEQVGVYKISMRSGSEYAANEICATFGGGGHARAAGAKIEASDMDEALLTVLKTVEKMTDLNIKF